MSGGAKLCMRAFKLLAKAGAGGWPAGLVWELWTFENWEDSISLNWEDLI